MGLDERAGSTAGLVSVVFGAPYLVLRSRTHPSPVMEPTLLRIRTFGIAISSFLLFSMGMFALLLGNILFLTGVWRYSLLQAGFAVTPGPLMAAVAARIRGRVCERLGPRLVAPRRCSCSPSRAWSTAKSDPHLITLATGSRRS